MKRFLVGLVLVGSVLGAAAPVGAEDQSARDVCLSIRGATEGADADAIAAGIQDGTITVDGLCGAEPSTTPGAPLVGDSGSWVVGEVERDPISDAAGAVSFLPADGSATIGLFIRCRDGVTEAFINWSDYLADEDQVLTRFDDDEPVDRAWSMSTDSTATFYPGNGDTFAKSLLEHDKLVARVTPYNSGPVTATFVLAGAEAALAPVREACGW